MRTVAEGVETVAQRDWVRAQGCDEIQGNLEAPPMSADDCEAWLRRRHAAGGQTAR
jgi:EAL domain-containing protein (putative c-di-GMP-specific phosphodiesterase class I)